MLCHLSAVSERSVKQQVALVVGIALVALAALFIPAHNVEAALIDRVNEAVREAGANDTVERSDAFQVGIVNGHYTSYTQLVGAVAYHKEMGTLPTFSSTVPTVATECITGDIISMSKVSISITGDVKNEFGTDVATTTLSIGSNQYDVATIDKGIAIGSNVTACSADNYASVHGHMTKN